MRRRWFGFLVVVVCVVAVHAQVSRKEYAGRKLCLLCHKTDQEAIVTAFPKTAHPNALFAAKDDERIKADFSAAPFGRESVAYVLGTGHHLQAYLDENWQILPAKWDVDEGKWQEIPTGDGRVECVGCHVTAFEAESREWKEMGVGCEMCHGPGKTHSMTMDAEERDKTIVHPDELEVQRRSMICGRCHSLGKEKDGDYAFATTFLPGQDLSELFVDARPAEPGLNQQFSDLIQSPKHWANEVGCTTCHDPHGTTGLEYQLKKPITELCLDCHAEDTVSLEEHVKEKEQTAEEGATCATCHMPDGRHLFDRTLAAAE